MSSKFEDINTELIEAMSEQEMVEQIFLLTAPVDINFSKLQGVESDRDKFDLIGRLSAELAVKLGTDPLTFAYRAAGMTISAFLKSSLEGDANDAD